MVLLAPGVAIESTVDKIRRRPFLPLFPKHQFGVMGRTKRSAPKTRMDNLRTTYLSSAHNLRQRQASGGCEKSGRPTTGPHSAILGVTLRRADPRRPQVGRRAGEQNAEENEARVSGAPTRFPTPSWRSRFTNIQHQRLVLRISMRAVGTDRLVLPTTPNQCLAKRSRTRSTLSTVDSAATGGTRSLTWLRRDYVG